MMQTYVNKHILLILILCVFFGAACEGSPLTVVGTPWPKPKEEPQKFSPEDQVDPLIDLDLADETIESVEEFFNETPNWQGHIDELEECAYYDLTIDVENQEALLEFYDEDEELLCPTLNAAYIVDDEGTVNVEDGDFGASILIDYETGSIAVETSLFNEASLPQVETQETEEEGSADTTDECVGCIGFTGIPVVGLDDPEMGEPNMLDQRNENIQGPAPVLQKKPPKKNVLDLLGKSKFKVLGYEL